MISLFFDHTIAQKETFWGAIRPYASPRKS